MTRLAAPLTIGRAELDCIEGTLRSALTEASSRN